MREVFWIYHKLLSAPYNIQTSATSKNWCSNTITLEHCLRSATLSGTWPPGIMNGSAFSAFLQRLWNVLSVIIGLAGDTAISTTNFIWRPIIHDSWFFHTAITEVLPQKPYPYVNEGPRKIGYIVLGSLCCSAALCNVMRCLVAIWTNLKYIYKYIYLIPDQVIPATDHRA